MDNNATDAVADIFLLPIGGLSKVEIMRRKRNPTGVTCVKDANLETRVQKKSLDTRIITYTIEKQDQNSDFNAT